MYISENKALQDSLLSYRPNMTILIHFANFSSAFSTREMLRAVRKNYENFKSC